MEKVKPQNDYLSVLKKVAANFISNDIFIIGKGASIDSVDMSNIKDSLIININDSELLLPGTICLLHKEWVIQSLREKGFKCDLYISDTNFEISAEKELLILDFIPYNQETSDLMIFRFLNPEFMLEEILFMTALKICLLIAGIKNKTQNAYMLGFDFVSGEKVYSEKISIDYSLDDKTFKKGFIRNQEFHFMELLSLFSERPDLKVKVMHVGNKPYSSLTSDQFNQLFRHGKVFKKIEVQETSVEASKSQLPKDEISTENVPIVAELTNNHLGDISRLRTMVRLVQAAGANYIKVQKRDVDSFYSREQLESYYNSPFGNTLGAYRKGVELDENGFDALIDECEKCGIGWFSSILDYKSYVFIKKYKPVIIKIPSTISEDYGFHQKISDDYDGFLVISTGFTLPDYEEYILNLFQKSEKIYLLHTVSAYPTPAYDCNIGILRHYRDLTLKYKNVLPGYSSHDIGSIGSMLAVAAGAKMVEKHVKLGDTEWIHFDNVALDLANNEFENFVKDIRLAEKMCGNEEKNIIKSEHHKYWQKKS